LPACLPACLDTHFRIPSLFAFQLLSITRSDASLDVVHASQFTTLDVCRASRAQPPNSVRHLPTSISQLTNERLFFSASRAGYQSRKVLAIKRNDAEPLTREDVQYDLLAYLFTDPNAVFTQPNSSRTEKVAFGDLYVQALYSSNKCSKVLKEKMHETPAFSVEFAKLALLTNVGRINTTMACEGH
jgi:hypothetical protein